jgi:hypothetical protein
MTLGCGCEGVLRALRNSRLAASALRSADKQEVNCGTRRIDRSIQVAPTTFHLDVSLVDTPRLVGWLQMASQALVEFRTIPLHPAPYGLVVGFQTTLLEQLFDIAQ